MSTDQSQQLQERTLEPLPLGAITPTGWLEQQLSIQASGLTGHLDEFWPDLADNQWLGGKHDGWERAPYYADGLVPLAYLLDDDDLIAKAEKWVHGFLSSQNAEGWIGPAEQARDQGYEYDPWPRFVVLKVFRQYYEATRDDDVLDAMVAFCDYLTAALDNQALSDWGKFRWADLVVTVHWLYEQTNDDWLLDLAAKAIEQGYDWTDHFTNFRNHRKPQPLDEITLESHVVNNAMGIKHPGIRYRQSGDDEHRSGVYEALGNLDRFHGQATGVFTGDEHFGGKTPTRGTELCAVVEYMYSLEKVMALFGDAKFGDRLERIAYNALPAALTPDMWSHQYDQQANQVLCNVAHRHWTNEPDANIFGIAPNFGCCTSNLHQGWPKFTTHLWMQSDDGVAAVAYAPSSVTTEVDDGVDVTITEETTYPFGDSITFTVDLATAVEFPLALRVPDWATNATVTLPNGTTERMATEDDFHEIRREWHDGDTIELSFSPTVTVERRHHGAVTLHRGPLVFSLPVSGDWKQIGGEEPHADWEVYPSEAWNYALDINPEQPESTVSINIGDIGETPFSPENPSMTLAVTGQQIEDWALEDNNAGDVPRSPVTPETELEELTLIPYGCTNLRITEFPFVVGDE